MDLSPHITEPVVKGPTALDETIRRMVAADAATRETLPEPPEGMEWRSEVVWSDDGRVISARIRYTLEPTNHEENP